MAALSNTDALPATTDGPFITGVDTPTSIIPSVPVVDTTQSAIVEPTSILPVVTSINTGGIPTNTIGPIDTSIIEPTFTTAYTQITPPPFTPITYTPPHTDIYTTYYTTYFIDICPWDIYCPGGTYNHYYTITEICTGDRATYTRPVIPPNYTTKVEPCPVCPGKPTLTITCPIETTTVVPPPLKPTYPPVVPVKPTYPPVVPVNPPVVPVNPPVVPVAPVVPAKPVTYPAVVPAPPQQTVPVYTKPEAPIQVQASMGSRGMAVERFSVALIGGVLAAFVVLA